LVGLGLGLELKNLGKSVVVGAVPVETV